MSINRSWCLPRLVGRTSISPPRLFYPLTLTRASSLSAIHRGLRRSEKARPQGYGSPTAYGRGSSSDGEARPPTYAERRRERLREAQKPALRIRRGIRDITEKSPGPPSRKARFRDPNDSFGKKSLVYQMKWGGLRDDLRDMEQQEAVPRAAGRSFSPSDTPYTNRSRERPVHSSDGFYVGRTRQRSFSESGDSYSDRTRTSSPALSESYPRRTRGMSSFVSEGSYAGRTGERTFSLPNQPYTRRGEEAYGDHGSARGRELGAADYVPRERFASRAKSVNTSVPPTIIYTTAASQFLYGKSVVEAALRAARRKLYTLYLYGGANRRNVSKDAVIERLAHRLGVKTVILDESGLRLMDKMAQGRPHNGFVLEASPLPQLPLIGLGAISDVETKPGFYVNIEHQSAEEAQVNGTSNFISTPADKYRPFVLVLDQVLDPGNLGAILRSASFLGVNAVAVSKKDSATLTPVALKASAGASEAMTTFSVDSTAHFLAESREAGWHIYAAAPANTKSRRRKQVDIHQVEEADPLSEDPCILLLGSEGEGLPRSLKDQADFEVNIPNSSGSLIVDSLNVSVAAGLLCSAFLKKRTLSHLDGAKDEPPLW